VGISSSAGDWALILDFVTDSLSVFDRHVSGFFFVIVLYLPAIKKRKYIVLSLTEASSLRV
jgi:hypothetical protein